jgi:hypothetical protein
MSAWFVTGASRGFGAEIVKAAPSRAEAKRPELEQWLAISPSTDHNDVVVT